jgi:hypothetical protein
VGFIPAILGQAHRTVILKMKTNKHLKIEEE